MASVPFIAKRANCEDSRGIVVLFTSSTLASAGVGKPAGGLCSNADGGVGGTYPSSSSASSSSSSSSAAAAAANDGGSANLNCSTYGGGCNGVSNGGNGTTTTLTGAGLAAEQGLEREFRAFLQETATLLGLPLPADGAAGGGGGGWRLRVREVSLIAMGGGGEVRSARDVLGVQQQGQGRRKTLLFDVVDKVGHDQEAADAEADVLRELAAAEVFSDDEGFESAAESEEEILYCADDPSDEGVADSDDDDDVDLDEDDMVRVKIINEADPSERFLVMVRPAEGVREALFKAEALFQPSKQRSSKKRRHRTPLYEVVNDVGGATAASNAELRSDCTLLVRLRPGAQSGNEIGRSGAGADRTDTGMAGAGNNAGMQGRDKSPLISGARMGHGAAGTEKCLKVCAVFPLLAGVGTPAHVGGVGNGAVESKFGDNDADESAALLQSAIMMMPWEGGLDSSGATAGVRMVQDVWGAVRTCPACSVYMGASSGMELLERARERFRVPADRTAELRWLTKADLDHMGSSDDRTTSPSTPAGTPGAATTAMKDQGGAPAWLADGTRLLPLSEEATLADLSNGPGDAVLLHVPGIRYFHVRCEDDPAVPATTVLVDTDSFDSLNAVRLALKTALCPAGVEEIASISSPASMDEFRHGENTITIHTKRQVRIFDASGLQLCRDPIAVTPSATMTQLRERILDCLGGLQFPADQFRAAFAVYLSPDNDADAAAAERPHLTLLTDELLRDQVRNGATLYVHFCSAKSCAHDCIATLGPSLARSASGSGVNADDVARLGSFTSGAEVNSHVSSLLKRIAHCNRLACSNCISEEVRATVDRYMAPKPGEGAAAAEDRLPHEAIYDVSPCVRIQGQEVTQAILEATPQLKRTVACPCCGPPPKKQSLMQLRMAQRLKKKNQGPGSVNGGPAGAAATATTTTTAPPGHNLSVEDINDSPLVVQLMGDAFQDAAVMRFQCGLEGIIGCEPARLDSAITLECNHRYHPDCLGNFITSHASPENASLVCPACEETNHACDCEDCSGKERPHHLTIGEMRGLVEAGVLQQHDLDVWTDRLLLSMKDVVYCNRCNTAYAKEGNRRVIQCQQCSGYSFCVECQQAAHNGQTCKEAEEEREQQNAIAVAEQSGLLLQKCPRCGLLATKDKECSRVGCERCKTVYCFACGVLRQPTMEHGNHMHWQGCPYYTECCKHKCTENGKVACPHNDTFKPDTCVLCRYKRDVLRQNTACGAPYALGGSAWIFRCMVDAENAAAEAGSASAAASAAAQSADATDDEAAAAAATTTTTTTNNNNERTSNTGRFGFAAAFLPPPPPPAPEPAAATAPPAAATEAVATDAAGDQQQQGGDGAPVELLRLRTRPTADPRRPMPMRPPYRVHTREALEAHDAMDEKMSGAAGGDDEKEGAGS